MVQLTGLMRKINGSVRDFTFKRVNGVTVVSEKVTEVTNPRTEAQMRQRCKWTNIAAMYRGIRTLLNKVFQSKEATQSDHNKFTQINLQQTPVYLTKQMVAGGACVAAPYQITHCSLPCLLMNVCFFAKHHFAILTMLSSILVRGISAIR